MKPGDMVCYKHGIGKRGAGQVGIILDTKIIQKSHMQVASVIGAEVFWRNGKIEDVLFENLEKIESNESR